MDTTTMAKLAQLALWIAVTMTLGTYSEDGTAATAESRAENALTIYSSAAPGAIAPDLYRPRPGAGLAPPQAIPGYAVVRHARPVELRPGRSTVRFTDIAGLIDPTTVRFSSLTDPDHTRVIEQNFQYDLVSTRKLMEKYIDRTITLERIIGDTLTSFSGKLLSTSDALILQGEDGQIHVMASYANVLFPELPGGLITRPTLEWDVAARRGGTHLARVAYQTGGMTWWADYNLVYAEGSDANSGWLDVGAWVSIINQSGASYPDARLKLIAGDVHRAEPALAQGFMRAHAARELAADAIAGFEEKSFFEFHLYTLGRPTTLPDNSTKQIELFPSAERVPAKKLLVYYGLPAGQHWFFPNPATDRDYGTQSNKKVDVYLEFENEKKRGLGIPLPAGRIRVSKLDSADDSLEFIGEDAIDHTPEGEKVLVKMGSAFDVVGERKQVDFEVDVSQDWMEEEIEITLRNHKEESVEVVVKENLYRWVNWQVKERSHDFEKQDARTIHFPVRVAADAEVTVRYRVRYSW